MTDRTNKVFIDSNMLMFAAEFQKADVFEWMDQLYDEIYIHQEVLNELILPSMKSKVETFLSTGRWQLFIPRTHLSNPEFEVYQERLSDVKYAFSQMRLNAIKAGELVKSTTDLGEIATLAACMMIGAQIICSNDFDIRKIVEQEDYCIFTDEADLPIIQDSAEDFCFHCYKNGIANRKDVRKFFGHIFRETPSIRQRKMDQLDNRLK